MGSVNVYPLPHRIPRSLYHLRMAGGELEGFFKIILDTLKYIYYITVCLYERS